MSDDISSEVIDGPPPDDLEEEHAAVFRAILDFSLSTEFPEAGAGGRDGRRGEERAGRLLASRERTA